MAISFPWQTCLERFGDRSWLSLYSASAPAMISISSVVMRPGAAVGMDGQLVDQVAGVQRVALSIADIEAPCSLAMFSSSAPNSCVRGSSAAAARRGFPPRPARNSTTAPLSAGALPWEQGPG